MTDLDALDFTPYTNLTIPDLRSAWAAEATKVKAWRRQLTMVAETTAATDKWRRDRTHFLVECISKAHALMTEYEDALLWHQKPKPTDIPAGVIL